MTITIRKPIQAGRFYPILETDLHTELDQFLSQAPKINNITNPKALICPHAGYFYSGQTAAHGYKQIQGMNFNRVILVAPSHYERFTGAAIFDCQTYQTPLGDIPVDRPFVENLVRESPLVAFSETVELQEHSLEVHLPFLQKCLGQFQLVPIILSKLDPQDSNALAYAIKQQLKKHDRGEQTLLVASSDLYHGHSHDDCLDSDSRFAAAIEQFDPEEFDRATKQKEFMACGAAPISLIMRLAKSTGATNAHILHQSTSRDATSTSDYVVGYAAAVFD